MQERITGVFRAVFLPFSWTRGIDRFRCAIERITSQAFWMLAVVIGSVLWVTGGSWGWHAEGWLVQLLGYHDAYAGGVIHAVAAGFVLGNAGGARFAHRSLRPGRYAVQFESAQSMVRDRRAVHAVYGFLGLLHVLPYPHG